MATQHQVDASTVDAATLFGTNRFEVPDFQRDYSWRTDDEVADFWQDLSKAIDSGEDYFLGLLVTTEGRGRREIVDGQQRLITLTLLANALRLIALAHDRQLVAGTLKTTFLASIDYMTEEQVRRIELTDPNDADALAQVVSAATERLLPTSGPSRIFENQIFLLENLTSDVEGAPSSELRIGQWAEFLTHGLRFAIFDHPDRSAAFRVYEVVNQRGKILTPAELIKSYVIGNSVEREGAVARWRSIEQEFEDISASDQLTTFVRHVVALRRGYVIPRELYRVVNRTYVGPDGVARLLDDLQRHLPVYLQLIDPSADVEGSEERLRSFKVLSALSATRFRPLILAAIDAGESRYLLDVVDIVVPGLLVGRFSTGSIEAQFARAARRLHQREAEWIPTLESLRGLVPSREEFVLRLHRNVPKAHAQVLRSALIQSRSTPDLLGHPHHIRPRNALDWPEFDAEAFRTSGGTLANWLLIASERRPPGTRSPDAVEERLLPLAIAGEPTESLDLTNWSVDQVMVLTQDLAERLGALWYGNW